VALGASIDCFVTPGCSTAGVALNLNGVAPNLKGVTLNLEVVALNLEGVALNLKECCAEPQGDPKALVPARARARGVRGERKALVPPPTPRA
jgi:recombinational DNA repair protein (RecF pathway)